MTLVNFGRQSKPGRDQTVSGVQAVNCYVEAQGKEGIAPLVVYAAPGLKRWDDGNWMGAMRAIVSTDKDTLYSVVGNEVIKYTLSGTNAKIGALAGSGKVFTSVNQALNPEVAIVTSDNQYSVLDTATDVVAASTATNLPSPTSVTFLDGYFIFSSGNQIWHTDLNDANTVNALAFATAESDADDIVRVFAHRGFLYVFGERSTEIWRDVATQPFAFQPENSDIDVGCGAPHSVVEVTGGVTVGESIFFVDNLGSVRLMSGSSHRVISTPSVSRAIEALTADELFEIECFSYWFQGHEMVAVKSSQFTWEYDVSLGVWHERKSQGLDRWQAQRFVLFDKKNLVGNENDGNIYEIDPDTYDEDGEPFTMSVVSIPIHAFPDHIIGSSLQLSMLTGFGADSADPEISDPKVMIDVSKNGGKTYTRQYVRDMGKSGETNKQIRVNRLGKADERGFTFRISSSSKVLRGIMIADLTEERLIDE